MIVAVVWERMTGDTAEVFTTALAFMLTSKIATILWTIWMNVTLSRLQIGTTGV